MHRKEGGSDPVIEYQLLKPSISSPVLFSISLSLGIRMRCFTPCWSLWLHISTDIEVSMPLGISAFFHVLEMVRAASSIFVERCKCINYPSLLSWENVLSWVCFVTFQLLVAGFHQQYCIKNWEPLSSLFERCNTILTFHVEGSLFPQVQVTSWYQREWRALHTLTVRIQVGITVIQKEITLHGKQKRKPLYLWAFPSAS